jgi:3-oxoacyl-[acyl-carrier-protein] synthase II
LQRHVNDGQNDNPVQRQPIVITGAGLACALGLNKRHVWDAIVRGECGIKTLTAIEQHRQCTKGGGQAPDLPDEVNPGQPREVRYLKTVIDEALTQSQYKGTLSPERCGIVLGTTLAGMRGAGEYFRTGDLERLTRFTAASILQLALGDLPVSGFATTTCSACASGLSSIAIAITLLRTGQLDLVIAGGYDTLSEYAYAGFNSLRLVADGPILPFSKDREGMKLGEGYGVMVLERLPDALERGVQPLAQVVGFGESSDAHHLTQPHPEGNGAQRAICAALQDASLEACDIDMIAAHATATPNNDAAEYQAYRTVFGDRLADVPVVAFKSHLGHTLGGAGAVELVLSMLAIAHQCVPPTANVVRESIEFADLHICTEALPYKITHTANVSMGFGGANACIVLGKPDAAQRAANINRMMESKRNVLITGIGLIAPDCIGNEQFMSRLNGTGSALASVGGSVDDSQIHHLINARRVRRMSEFAKIMLAATSMAIKDAAIDDVEAFTATCNAILGTTHGAIDFSETYYRQIVEQGMDAANPMLFAEGVPNVASAQLSLMLNIQGSTQTIVGSRTAGLEALCIAIWRIQTGAWERAIVGAAEEFHPLVNQAYDRCQQISRTPTNCSSGAVALVLESRGEVERRNARVRGTLRTVREHRTLGTPRCSADAMKRINNFLHETFSVMPLAEIAAALLKGDPAKASRGRPLHILGHDVNGFATGIAVELL